MIYAWRSGTLKRIHPGNLFRIFVRLLSCGHTFCEYCILAIIKKAQSKDTEVLCPNCKSSQTSLANPDEVKKLMKNYNLIRIVEKMEIRKSQISQAGKKSFAGKLTDKTVELSFNSKFMMNSLKDNLDEKKSPDKKVDKMDKFEKKKCEKSDKNLIELDSSKNIDSQFNEPCAKHGLPIHSYAVGTKLLFCDKCALDTNLKTSPLPSVRMIKLISIRW